jgi:hypothetical protein
MYPSLLCGDTLHCTILHRYRNIYYLPVDWFGKTQYISLASTELPQSTVVVMCHIMHKGSRHFDHTANACRPFLVAIVLLYISQLAR